MEKVKKIKSNLPLIAIVGRTNVGKSTLFNKFIEQQKALIANVAGTTRDLNFGICYWRDKQFEVVDTGGLFETKIKNDSQSNIIQQTELKAQQILSQADLVLFLTDIKSGLLKDDRLIAQLIKKQAKKYLLVVNKCDNQSLFSQSVAFKKLGLGQAHPVSATTGKGVGDLLDQIIKNIKKQKIKKIADQKIINVSIVGKPNVGKSSLLNQILGEERVLVSDQPHTTREPQDTLLEFNNHLIKLVDTAGIRKKSKVKHQSLEASGINMSINILKKSNIALFVIDISQNLSQQDAQLAGLIINAGVSLIFVANKYDLIETDTSISKKLTDYIYSFFPFLTWAPVIFVSAKSGKNVPKILKLILEINDSRQQQIDKTALNELLHGLMKKMPPPRQPRKKGSPKKSRAFIAKAWQKDNNPPVFQVNVTNSTKIPDSYLNYLSNNLRKKFKFLGTPIKLVINRAKK